jgi:threonine dehydratase
MDLTPEVTVLVPVSGGGLLAGIAAALTINPQPPRIIGVQAEASAFMYALFNRNNQENVTDLTTLADGLSGPVENGSITIPLIKSMVDEILLVNEEDISRSVAFAYYVYGEIIEGAAAVGLAAVSKGAIKTPAVVIISGGNVQPEIHSRICERYKDLK